MDHSENEDITIKRADGAEKVVKTRIRNGCKSMSASVISFHTFKIYRSTRKYSSHTRILFSLVILL